jgi:1-acyl-sn-glycerol-3-phosphate acyltransferase
MVVSRVILACFLIPLVAVAILACNLGQMASLVIRPFSPPLFRAANRLVVDSWFNLLRWSLTGPIGLEIRQSGDELPWRENAFLISNHQAMADIPVLVAVAHNSGRMGDLKWFVKDPIKWVPGIGWGMQFIDSLFVKRNWMADQEKVRSTFRRIRDHHTPFWVVSFLEGTRATPAKIASSQAFGQRQGLPHLERVMLPRTKGFVATLEGLGDLNQAIYIATIAYEGKPPGILNLFFGPVKRIHVHLRRYTSWPESAEERTQWIIARYQEKDALLARFYASGSFT